MPTNVTYGYARVNFARLCARATDDREVFVIERPDGEDVALVAADELTSILETIYLLSSPANAERLRASIADAEAGKGERMTVDELRRAVGL